MANLLFQLEPIAHRQVEFIIPDKEWEELQKQLPEGYVADDVYTLVNEKYRGVEIAVEVYGGGVAFDYEVRDCDCGE